jgi:acyl-homoserine-lactone acylase
MSSENRVVMLVLAAIAYVHAAPSTDVGVRATDPALELWRQVEVIRTAHGVPHIRAENLRAAGYALAWLQCEDYGDRTPMRLAAARGIAAKSAGRAALESDFEAVRARPRAIETYHLLDAETRDVYDGFAAGVNRYVTQNPAQFPPAMPRDFSGYDVAALHIGDGPTAARVRRFLTSMGARTTPPLAAGDPDDQPPDSFRGQHGQHGSGEEGSNAWALAPSRTKSRKAILLRNPHLAWTAGYYEAHLTVPGVVDFYGDFRIGGPLGIVGGFNWNLGWATTNSNSGDLTEIYAIRLDPARPDHYLLNGASLPLRRETTTVAYLTDSGLADDTRDLWSTPLGPVIHRSSDTIYIARTAGDLEFRAGEQFLRMMRAKSMAEWLDAMKIRALVTSNYTYADRAGNILYLWNASLPLLPHARNADGATPAGDMRDLWTRYIPFEALPQFRNPRGGYIHNENDSPHFTNVREKINTTNAYPNIEPPMLRLRSQHAIELVGGTKRFSLEDVVRLKHSYRMLLADRVKPDLLKAISATAPTGNIAAALTLIRKWNNTAAPDSRGAVLFSVWWSRYTQDRPPNQQFAAVWSEAAPLTTPRGLADPARAAESFAWAVDETIRRHGRIDVPWGEVHRVRRGRVDVPVGGCPGALGCFRVLGFTPDATDGKLVATSGDGWVLAVEFGDTPRAYSVLAYGESPRRDSPWHDDQAAMFARGELKKVAFTARDVDAQAVLRYRPGAPH